MLFRSLYAGISMQPDKIQKDMESVKANLQSAKVMYGKPFESEGELAKLLERQSFLNAQLEFGGGEAEKEVFDENASEDDEDEDCSPEM